MYPIRILGRQRRAPGLPPINPLEQHRQLSGAQRHRTARRLRPDEFPGAQTFVEEAQPILAVPEHLDSVAAFATEDIELAGERVGVQPGLYQCTQAIKAAAQIGEPRDDPDPHTIRWPDHEPALLVAD